MRFLSSEQESIIPAPQRVRIQLTSNADFPAVGCRLSNWAGPFASAIELLTDKAAYGFNVNSDWCTSQGALILQGSTNLCPLTGTVTVAAGAVDACTPNSPNVAVTVSGAPSARTWVANVAITPTGAPTATLNPALGYPVTWSVEPPLIDGLSVNPATGVISGTPRYVVPTQNFVLKATCAGGWGDAVVPVTVQALPNTVTVATVADQTWTHGSAITNVTPSATDSNPAVTTFTWSISPALPGGVSLNTSTGVISGTPAAAAGSTLYTLTATETGTGSTGSAGSKTFHITVN